MTWQVAYGFKLDGVYYIRRDTGHSVYSMPMMNDDYAVKCASILFHHYTATEIKERLLAIYNAATPKNLNKEDTVYKGYSVYSDKDLTLYHSDKHGSINASMWYVGHESQMVVSEDPAAHCDKLKWGRWGPGAQLIIEYLKANGESIRDPKINLAELHYYMNMETFQDIFLDCHIYQPDKFERQLSDNDIVTSQLSWEFTHYNPSLYQSSTAVTIIDFDDMQLKCYKSIESADIFTDDCGFASLVDCKPAEYNLKVLMNRYYKN